MKSVRLCFRIWLVFMLKQATGEWNDIRAGVLPFAFSEAKTDGLFSEGGDCVFVVVLRYPML